MPDGTVALLSAASYAHLDEDLPLLVPAVEALGIDVVVADWHDRSIDWAAHALVVIRSPWDYTDHVDEFLSVLVTIGAATTLANPFDVVQTNLDKRYLARLTDLGVPVVSTTVLEPGDEPAVPAGQQVVVKPTVSAGARDTDRYGPDETEAALAHVGRLLDAGRNVLVQPYVASVDERGETGLVFLGDELSHAFRKGPILRPGARFVEGLYREEQIDPRAATAAEREVAEVVLDAVADLHPGRSRRDLLYARVDLVESGSGPVLMELELTEPSLFLTTDPASAGRAAAAIARALAAT